MEISRGTIDEGSDFDVLRVSVIDNSPLWIVVSFFYGKDGTPCISKYALRKIVHTLGIVKILYSVEQISALGGKSFDTAGPLIAMTLG